MQRLGIDYWNQRLVVLKNDTMRNVMKRGRHAFLHKLDFPNKIQYLMYCSTYVSILTFNSYPLVRIV